MLALAAPRATGRRLDGGAWLTMTVLGFAATAWLAMAWLDARGAHVHGTVDTSPALGHHDHHDHVLIGMPTTPSQPYALVVLGWVAMVMAMMLPPALPLLHALRRLTAGRSGGTVLLILGGAAFVSVWAVAGATYVIADTLVDALRAAVPAIAHRPQVVAGSVVVAAGLFQISPLKTACLTACRSPRALILARWTGERPAAITVMEIGARFGAVCVACCWALMAITFVVGVAAMPVMVVLAVVMAAERFVPNAEHLVRAVAAGCVVLGVLLMAGLVPTALT